jgi:protein-histidine pros-kinase
MDPEFNQLLLEELSDAIIAKSREGRVLFWNRGAERVFGYPAEEAVGQMVSELIIPHDLLEEETRILHDVLEEDLSQYETTRRKKDGSLIYVDVSSKAVRNDHKEFQFILSSNKDVTRLKVLRDAKLAEARYAGILESTPDGMIISNPAGHIVLANSETERLFGYGRGELLGQPVDILLPSRLRGNLLDHRSPIFVLRPSRSMGAGMELYGERKDGTEFPVEINLSPLATDQGWLVMGAIRDITERKNAEQKFRDQARIMELVNDSVMLRDMNDRVTYWNQGAQQTYGWTAAEALGQISHTLLKTIFPRPLEDIRAKFLAEEHWEGELIHTRRDGSTLTVASRWTLQRDAASHPAAVIELNYDITDRKRIEQMLQEKNLELQNAAEDKNRFLANMSHELRTPLNGIIGFAEFLSDGKPGPLNLKQREYLMDILNSGRHLLQLINDVLDLAKVEANKMDFHPEKFQLRTAIDGICAVAKPIAQKKHIQLTLVAADDLGEVVIDAQKFKQVLYNLLSNAIKFTDDEGEVEVTARLSAPGRFILSVRDTGIGIRKEDFPRLFTEFQQLKAGAARHYEGTGLGLALTRKIVELQGGTITVESEVGAGSTFTVELPIHSPQSGQEGLSS